ncbi:MAG: TolC family protein [Rickettsiales bacterium]|nr:TolC family protein [Pseudomonadota bacterium]MDA0966730.1 TolC family protein [Pseudomonadota bacterium]MDG4544485.1 TolC family protein [Rickettsiales bacterium]MDG4546600.1 TolC family protein [Rickettsiales bacterium]MDG4548725.1 TolC family protein [Rickettsiales bacterium]
MFNLNSINQKFVSAGCTVFTALFLTSCATKIEPLTEDEIKKVVKQDAKFIAENRVSVDKPVTIYDAMAMALVNNLDYRVQLLEQAVAQGQFDVAKFNMYPKLNSTVGASHRNPARVSNSESLATGLQSLEPSTSEDRDRSYGDLTFSWNVIDFGVSYYQAKQEANKVLIAKELRRKALQGLLVRVREAYWKAAASQALKERVDNIIVQVKAALRKAEKVEEQKLRPPLESLRFQRSLMQILQEMKAVKDDLEKAEIELYQLLNIPMEKGYELSFDELDFEEIPIVNIGKEELIEMALVERPELREEIYRHKISYAETKKAMLRLLPGLELKAAENFDSNSFLVDQWWQNASAQVTANLVDIATYKTRINAAEVQEDLAIQKRMALQVAILSQVNISYKDYENSMENLDQARKVSDIDEQISRLVDISARNEVEIELERIKTSAAAISTKLQEFQSYANFQNAFGRLLFSVGYDVVDIDGEYHNIYLLSDHFKEQFAAVSGQTMTSVIASIKERPKQTDVNGIY